MISLFCLMQDSSEALGVQDISERLAAFFSGEKGVDISFEENPFDASAKNILLAWDGWWARLFYEQGREVLDDSRTIASICGENSSCLVSSIDKRIRVLFPDDDSRIHTNHVIFVIEFLQSIPGLLIFDPQAKEFVD